MFTHPLKRLIARVSIATILFMQLAVAAYACTGAESPATVISAATMENAHAAMAGCDMGKPGNPNLCVQHCAAGDQSVQTLPQIPVPAFCAASVLTVIEPVPATTDNGVALLSAVPKPDASPPPLVLFGVLRI
jgi:hypothetical protein